MLDSVTSGIRCKPDEHGECTVCGLYDLEHWDCPGACEEVGGVHTWINGDWYIPNALMCCECWELAPWET